MTNSAACGRCAKMVKKEDDYIECMGFCDQICHTRCAGLNNPFVKVLRDKTNLFWMCDECVKLMKYARFKNVVSSLDGVISIVIGNQLNGILELKDEMIKNNHHVAQLTNKVNAVTPLRVLNRDRPSKRRRGDVETPNKLSTGTRSVGNDTLVAGPQLSLFWVYLSRFHPTVTIDVVEKLTRDRLQTRDKIKVVSLVKKGTDPLSLNFVSFKVGVPIECKAAALDPNTWPKGIVFRQFDDYQVKATVWLPSTDRDLPSTPRAGPSNDTAAGSSFATPSAVVSLAPFGVSAPTLVASQTPTPDVV